LSVRIKCGGGPDDGFLQPEEREQELTLARAGRARQDSADSANPSAAKAIGRWLSPSNVGALYVWVILIVAFAVWIPNLFLSYKTVASIVNQNSISAVMAFSILIPLSAGVFDLSIGSVMGLAGLQAAGLRIH
jgi:ABC-type xylose transport system permease subunit